MTTVCRRCTGSTIVGTWKKRGAIFHITNTSSRSFLASSHIDFLLASAKTQLWRSCRSSTQELRLFEDCAELRTQLSLLRENTLDKKSSRTTIVGSHFCRLAKGSPLDIHSATKDSWTIFLAPQAVLRAVVQPEIIVQS